MAGGNIRSHNKSFEAHQLDLNAKFENIINQNTNRDHAQFFSTPAPIQKSFKDYLNLNQGGVLASPIAWNPSKTTIDTGAIDIGRDSGKLSGFVIVSAETGTTDDLTDINNFVFGYQDLTLLAAAGHIITIKTTGNVNISEDLALTDSQAATLFYNTISESWEIKGGIGDGGGTGITFPITPPVDVRGSVGANQNIVLTDTDAHSTTLTLTADIDITFSGFPTSGTQIEWEVEITQDGTGGWVVTWPAEVVNPPSLSTVADSVAIVVLRTNDGGTTVRVGNTVTTTAGTTTLSGLTIDVLKDWQGFGITNIGEITMAGDINVNTFDIIDIDRATFADDGSSITANDVTQLLLNSSGSFQTNTDIGNDFIWTINNITLATFAAANITFNPTSQFFINIDSDPIVNVDVDGSSNGVLTVQSPDDTGGPILNLFRNDIDGAVPSPIIIGNIGFQTGTTVASAVAEYASILAVAEVVTTGVFEGSMDLLVADGSGSQSVFLSINDGANNLVDIFKQLDMNSNKIVNVTDPTADQEAATKKYVDDNVIAGANTTLSNLVNPTAINQSLNMGTSTSLQFGSSNEYTLSAPLTTLNFGLPDGSEIKFFFDSVEEWSLSADTLVGDNIILGQSILINDSSSLPAANGQFSRDGNAMALQAEEFVLRNDTSVATEYSELSLIKVDADPILSDFVGRLNFGIDDSGTVVNYAGVYGAAKEITDSGILQLVARSNNGQNTIGIQIEGDDDITRTYATINSKINSDFTFGVENGAGGTFIIAPDLNAGAGVELGIVVQDNVGFTTGTSGTLAMPSHTTAVPPTASELNGDFGTHEGAMGFSRPTTTTNDAGKLFIRNSDGAWFMFSSVLRIT